MNIDAVNIVTVASAALSALGALSIIASFVMFPTMRQKQGRQLLFALSIADLATALGYAASLTTVIRRGGNSTACDVQAVLVSGFSMATFLWTDCVAYYSYRMVNGGKPLKSTWPMHVLCWGVPALLAGTAAAVGVEGRSAPTGPGGSTGGWCWVRHVDNASQELVFMLLDGKGVEWLSVFVITPVFYWLLRRRVQQQLATLRLADRTISSAGSTRWTYGMQDGERTQSSTLLVSPSAMPSPHAQRMSHVSSADVDDAAMLDDSQGSLGDGMSREHAADRADDAHQHTGTKLSAFARRLSWVPIIFLAARLPGNLRIILGLCGWDHASSATLIMTQAIFDPVQGAANAVLFVGLSSETRALFAGMCRRRCACCCPRRGDQSLLRHDPQ